MSDGLSASQLSGDWRHRTAFIVAAVSAAIIFALLALSLHRGQDVNWDQLNYHFALPDMLLHDSYWRQLAPSQMQTWFNPLAYVPYYWLAQRTDSYTFRAILTIIHGLNVPLIFLLALRVLPDRTWPSLALAALATVIGATAATFLGELGTTFFDIVASILILAALLLLTPRATTVAAIAAAGLLVGIATGLKQPNAIFAAAMALALIVTSRWPQAIARCVIFAAASACGLLLSAGWWMASLWEQYGNPLFPYFDKLFPSVWLRGGPAFITGASGADTKFIPPSLFKAALLPAKFAIGRGWTSEYFFRDGRFLLICLLVIATVVMIWRDRAKRSPLSNWTAQQRFLIAFWIFSIFIWLPTFAIQRYIVVLEALTGIVMLAMVLKLIQSDRTRLLTMGAFALLLGVTTAAPDYGAVPFRASMIATREATPLYVPRALYVVVGGAPLGYLIPAMPRDTQFVRIDGNMPLSPSVGLGKLIADTAQRHRGPIVGLWEDELTANAALALQRFGFAATGACRRAPVLNQHLQICTLIRITPGG